MYNATWFAAISPGRLFLEISGAMKATTRERRVFGHFGHNDYGTYIVQKTLAQ
jgi:hypothetical protein